MTKKIVFFTNSSWAAWNMRSNLGLYLKEHGYDVCYLCPKDRYSQYLIDNFGYVDIDVLNAKGTNPLEDLKLLVNIYKKMKKIKPDILLQYTIKPNVYGSIVARVLKIPVINNIAGLGALFIENNIYTKVAKILYKISQRKVNLVFFQNSEDFKLFTNANIVNADKADILPGSGVDIDKFSPLNNGRNDKFTFILPSRMLWAKGIAEFVEAAKNISEEYKNTRFQLLGHLDCNSPDAISKDEMHQMLVNTDIEYLGVSDNIQNELGAADCVVLPSFYREGTPRILLESASMAKPIITTDNVGCRDVVDDSVNGFICKAKDADDLAKQMRKILNMSENELSMMGRAGREKMKREFNEIIVLEKYLKAVREIVG